MQYGFVLPNGEARDAAELGREAEAAGWDGFFVIDCVWGVDPWVSLAAVAMVTEKIRLGTMLTPVSRRRPWTLASQTATLDRLSHGRVTLSVGLGALDTGFEAFGEETDRRARAELLDEGLAIMTGLWQGQPFRFEGKHFHIRESAFFPPPPPVQAPRIPIWVAGVWPRKRSMERVLRWDGLIPEKREADGSNGDVTPDDIRAIREFAAARRSDPIDIVSEGRTPGDERDRAASMVSPYADAGATWWLESMWTAPNAPVDALARLRQGPPRID
ncbi:MAG: LLM class flavin-dependent oxidoreductase [Chloroflexota bacterium]